MKDLTPLEKEFFEDKDFWGYINSEDQRAIVAKAAASLCEKKMKEAWNEGYNDGCSDGQSYSAGYPQKTKNSYEHED